jgi:hypothetical protein
MAAIALSVELELDLDIERVCPAVLPHSRRIVPGNVNACDIWDCDALHDLAVDTDPVWAALIREA